MISPSFATNSPSPISVGRPNASAARLLRAAPGADRQGLFRDRARRADHSRPRQERHVSRPDRTCSYLPFEQPVPISGPDGVVERGVLDHAGKISERAQAAVRPISIGDFNRILDLGMPDEEPLLRRTGLAAEIPLGNIVSEEHTLFQFDVERERVAAYGSCIVRDAYSAGLCSKPRTAVARSPASNSSMAAAGRKWKRRTCRAALHGGLRISRVKGWRDRVEQLIRRGLVTFRS